MHRVEKGDRATYEETKGRDEDRLHQVAGRLELLDLAEVLYVERLLGGRGEAGVIGFEDDPLVKDLIGLPVQEVVRQGAVGALLQVF